MKKKRWVTVMVGYWCEKHDSYAIVETKFGCCPREEKARLQIQKGGLNEALAALESARKEVK